MGERWQHVLLLLVLEEIWETPSFEVGTIFLSPRAPCGVRAKEMKGGDKKILPTLHY
jgi:hypothetical protein